MKDSIHEATAGQEGHHAISLAHIRTNETGHAVVDEVHGAQVVAGSSQGVVEDITEVDEYSGHDDDTGEVGYVHGGSQAPDHSVDPYDNGDDDCRYFHRQIYKNR